MIIEGQILIMNGIHSAAFTMPREPLGSPKVTVSLGTITSGENFTKSILSRDLCLPSELVNSILALGLNHYN